MLPAPLRWILGILKTALNYLTLIAVFAVVMVIGPCIAENIADYVGDGWFIWRRAEKRCYIEDQKRN